MPTTNRQQPAQSRIKLRALDLNLPERSPLREYLATKDETAKVPLGRSARKPIRYCAPFSAYPRTLLVLPPTCLYEGAVKRVIPPLGLCYIAAYCERHGIDVDILDCIVEGIDEERQVADGVWTFGLSEDAFCRFLRAHDYDVIGFSMIYSSDLHNLYRYAELAKTVNPKTIVIAGGLHASIYTQIFLEDAVRGGRAIVDFVIRGEGERRLVRFLKDLRDGIIDKQADGLAGWIQGEMFVNPQFEVIENLDELPIPAYHKVPLQRYFDHNVPFSPYPQGQRVMQLLTSRGCPIGCTFCASTNFAKQYRTRSVENVIAEVRFYQNAYGIDELQFADDNLTLNRTRSLQLFDRLKDCGLPWCTPNGIMVNTLSEELLDAMILSGLYQITLSVDSGNAETLRERHRKPVNLERLPDLMAYLAKKGVLMHGTLVVGMPGESELDIAKGFEFVERLPFHSLNVFIAQAIPGSELFEKAVSEGNITYQQALHIDTARATLALNSIEAPRLEAMVGDFLDRYNKIMFARDPSSWRRKYNGHADRMKRMCVGKPSAITSTIMLATEG